MAVVVQIPPIGSGPGLIGYECPKCVYVTSVLWRQADNPMLGLRRLMSERLRKI